MSCIDTAETGGSKMPSLLTVCLGRALQLPFDADQPARTGLPVVANLTTTEDTLRSYKSARLRIGDKGTGRQTHLVLAGLNMVVTKTITDVAAHVETAPTIRH